MGQNAVTELLKSGGAVDTVYLADFAAAAGCRYYTALASQTGAVVKRVPGHKLQKICGTDDHQAWPPAPPRCSMPRWRICLPLLRLKAKHRSWMQCDGVEDPHNLGAIIRSAYLCGAHGVVIPKRGGVGVTGTVMKSSAGAAARLPVARVSNLAQAIRTIKEHNILRLLADLGGEPLARTEPVRPGGPVPGSEGRRSSLP